MRAVPGPSLDKPDWTRCPHQCAVGCGIHAERPEECREFDCLWLEGHGPEGDRPDLSGVIAWSSGDTGAHLFETRAGVVASPAGRACLERWRALRGPLRLFALQPVYDRSHIVCELLSDFLQRGQLFFMPEPCPNIFRANARPFGDSKFSALMIDS